MYILPVIYGALKSTHFSCANSQIHYGNQIQSMIIYCPWFYIANPGHAPPPPAWGGGGKNFRKVFAGGVRSFYFGGEGGTFVGGGSHNFEVKIKTA